MKLVTIERGSERALGVLEAGQEMVVDLGLAAPDLPSDMTELICLGRAALARIRQALETASAACRRPLAGVRLLAPIPRPARNIFCVGKNYHDHAREFDASGYDATSGGKAIPEAPIFFTKATTSVIGPGAPIPAHLDDTASVDYEGELAIVIGEGGRDIAPQRAYGHVFGYTIINDVTSRKTQGRHKQWFLGKSYDGFCPMGPCLVTADEMGDVKEIELRTLVNGELRQRARVADLIFDIPAMISTLSAVLTLEPGDVIATGTPAGVGIGLEPPAFLKRGDVVRIEIDRIGALENPVA